MQCKICNNNLKTLFENKILNKYNIKYFYCEKCGFIQTEEPYWINESYKDPINKSDTGYVNRNIELSKKVFVIFWYLFGINEKYLDYGAGYGMFTRLMRDYGLDYYWQDLYTNNLFAKGFEYKDQKIKVISSFECFEHFENPMREIEKMLNISRNILFSTVLFSKEKINNLYDWWYFGFDHGQHISIYSRETLLYIAKKYNLYFYEFNANLFLFSEKKINKLVIKKINLLNRLYFYKILNIFIKGKMMDDCFFIKSKM